MSFLVDTYGLIEWYVQGNPNYEPYFKSGAERHITKLSLLEFYHQVYHRVGKEAAEKYYEHLKGYSEIEDLTEEIIKESGAFRSTPTALTMLQRKKSVQNSSPETKSSKI